MILASILMEGIGLRGVGGIYRFLANWVRGGAAVTAPHPVRARSSAQVASLRCPTLCAGVCEFIRVHWMGLAARRVGSYSVPDASIEMRTASSRSATPRRARPCECPLARSAW